MTINIEVTPRGNEPFEKMLRRFSRKYRKEQIRAEVYDRMHFKSPKTKRKEKSAKRKRQQQKRKHN